MTQNSRARAIPLKAGMFIDHASWVPTQKCTWDKETEGSKERGRVVDTGEQIKSVHLQV